MAKALNISFSIDRTTIFSFGLSTAAHIAAICGLATVVVQADPSTARSASSLLGLDSPLAQMQEERRVPPPPATQQDIERLLAKVLPEQPKEEPEELRVRLGIDDGKTVTESWLGHAEATEQSATKSPVEQSAFTIEAGKPGETQAPDSPESQAAVAAAESETLPGIDEKEATEKVALEGAGKSERGTGEEEADRQQKERQEFQQQLRAILGLLVPTAVDHSEYADLVKPGASRIDGSDRETQEAKERVEASKYTKSGASAQAPVPAANPTASESPNRTTSPRPLFEPRTSGNGKAPGEPDDRESEATSLNDPIDITINGKVASAKGLKIRTVQPEFATTTRLTARPRSPQVSITFNKTGKVVRAAFTPGRSTGYEDVDQPLLNAIYRWTARGETLAKLAAASPRAELTITVNVLFP